MNFIFELHWGEIGWQLERLRGPGNPGRPEDVRKAFEPLRGKYGEDKIAPFLRPTAAQASSSQIRKTRKALAKAYEEEADAQTAHDSQMNSCQEARAAVFEASPEHRQSLKKEITRRLKNVRALGTEETVKKKIFQNADRALRKAESANRSASEAECAKSKAEYQKAKAEHESAKAVHEAEKQIVQETKARLSAASDDRWALAKVEAEKCEAELKKLQGMLAEAKAKQEGIEKTLRDQEAGFAQAELAHFLKGRVAAHTPRNLANAIAGLPDIGCRVSFRRCQRFSQKVPFQSEPGLNFQTFQFIARGWRKRSSLGSQTLLELFRSEIMRLPKTKKANGKTMENYFRRHLEENWPELRDAIRETLKSRTDPRQVPYRILVCFQRNLSKTKTALDRVLTAHERSPLS